MALYGDLTYDSRVRKEARTLTEAGYEVVITCLASQAASPDLPASVMVLIVRPFGPSIIPGSPNPFATAHAGHVAGFRRRVAWLVAYVRGLREWGRLVVEAAGPVDVWHAHDLTGLAAIIPNLPSRFPIVYDSHELFLETGTALRLPGLARSLLRAYERRAVSRTSAVITVNDEIASVLRRRYRPTRIEVVHNCPYRWSPPPIGVPLLREAADIPVGEPIVLYHGGLTAGRGVELLMQAMDVEGLEDVHLILMGYGERSDEFRRLARSDRGSQRIHVLDPVPPSDLLPWVASADVGAMPNPGMTRNDYFSSPNKLFECLAAGIPVIASDVPTMRRIIIDDPDGPLGALCDPTSTASIAAAMWSIVRLNPSDKGALRARCLRAADERWNWEREGETLLSVYSEVIPRRR
jgi:glycosyltransferase involved in cell wall biosynthesis